MDVVKFSKFQYAMFNLLGYLSLVLGTMFYNNYLKDFEVRTLIRFASIIRIINCTLDLVFVNRLNVAVGIPDWLFIISSDLVLGTLSMGLTMLPMMVLFAKITPKAIEASCFAMLTGVTNLSWGFLSPTIGTQINERFVGVSSDNLKDMPQLCMISFTCSFIPLLFVSLIPLKDDIKKMQ